MTNLSRPAIRNEYPKPGSLRWSRSEKTIARRAFDAALKWELHDVMQEAKGMASRIKEPSELWDLEHLLTLRRKEIDRKYDHRYSELTQVLGRLLHEKRVSEEDLRGLRGRQTALDPFLPQILGEGRGVTSILSANAWFQQLRNTLPES